MELLCNEIYPRYPEMVRNDSKTAKIIHGYLAGMSSYYHEHGRKNPSKLTPNQFRAVYIGLHYLDLAALGPESLRKHIRYLWSSGQLPDRLKFRHVKPR